MYYDDEEKYLRSLKQEDSYHFSIPFEYIQKKYENDEYDIATTNMEVDVQWSDEEMGYKISYYVPEMYLIDSAQGNSDADEFYEYSVQNEVLARLDSMGITSEALVFGNGL